MARTVLVADDSPSIQKKAQGILKGEGFEVETVSNGVAAIKKLAKIRPIVVLADVSMPGRDGYEVCDFVKNSAELRHVPVLLIASEMEPYDEERGARVHADGKITKPFEPQELIATVTRLAAQAEAAEPKAQPAKPAPPPPSAFEVAPTEEEIEEAAVQKGPELGSFSEGIAFAEPGAEESPPAPHAAAPEPPAAELTVEAEVSIAPPAAEESPAVAEDFPRAEAAPAVELPPVPPESVLAEEPLAAAPEPPPVQAEPVLVEEPLAAAPELPPMPATEQTMMFHTPAQIAEPMLSEEPGTAEAASEPASMLSSPEPTVAATSLDSYSLNEATAGQVRIAPAESEGVPVVEPAPQAAGAPDPRLVYLIVHKAVVKMSPPALSPEMVEDMARKLADEIVAELSSESYPTQ